MMRLLKTVFIAVLLFSSMVLSYPVLSEIYKWKDENGKTHFSDQAPLSGDVTPVAPKLIHTQVCLMVPLEKRLMVSSCIRQVGVVIAKKRGSILL